MSKYDAMGNRKLGKWDPYDQELYPGDLVALRPSRDIYLKIGKVSHISSKGTIYWHPWDGERKMFSAEVRRSRTDNFIKLTPEMGVQIK